MRALVLTMAVGFATLCRADVVTLTLTENPLSGQAGTEVDFNGTLTNDTDQTVFINSDSFTFPLGGLDDSPFLNNAPFSLDPFQTSTAFEVFDVVIPAGSPNGNYAGAFTVLGGSDGNAMDNLGTASFQVDVTPEPASFPFLGAGLVALIYARRRFSR